MRIKKAVSHPARKKAAASWYLLKTGHHNAAASLVNPNSAQFTRNGSIHQSLINQGNPDQTHDHIGQPEGIEQDHHAKDDAGNDAKFVRE